MEECEKLLLVVNPQAGTMKFKPIFADMIDLFCRYSQEVTVYMTRGRGDATEVVRQRGDRFDNIVCCGGDGTLNEVISGIMQLKKAPVLGYIPAGTTNDFASSMKIPTNMMDAARKAVCGEITPVDIGLFNTRYFSYVASFGAFTESSYATPQHIKNALGHIAYIIEGMKDLHHIRPYHLKVQVGEEAWEGDYLFGCVSNSTSIGGIVKLDEARVDMRDGKFEVVLVKSPKNASEAQKIVSGILSQQFDGEVIRFFTASDISFYPEERLPWSLDGEYEEGHLQVRVRNLHAALKMRV